MRETNTCKQESRRYWVISKICHDVDLGFYRSYGITVTSPDYTETIHDISSCEETVIRMADIFTECQLSPVHFQDAVEDMICDWGCFR